MPDNTNDAVSPSQAEATQLKYNKYIPYDDIDIWSESVNLRTQGRLNATNGLPMLFVVGKSQNLNNIEGDAFVKFMHLAQDKENYSIVVNIVPQKQNATDNLDGEDVDLNYLMIFALIEKKKI